uniref:endothelin-converting enzyme 1-like n=1 Tax=Myxine glutinosa TaxID=7769 RepID=UPI00358EC05A
MSLFSHHWKLFGQRNDDMDQPLTDSDETPVMEEVLSSDNEDYQDVSFQPEHDTDEVNEFETDTITPNGRAKIKAGAAAVGLLALCSLTGIIFLKLWKQQPNQRPMPMLKTCQTEICRQSAAAILENMDTTADPCEDFYQYACGGWLRENPLPAEKEKLDIWDNVALHNLELVKDVLENEKFDENKAKGQAQKMYQACMDENNVEKQGAQPMQDLISQLGGWINEDSTPGESLEELMANVTHQFLNPAFFTLKIQQQDSLEHVKLQFPAHSSLSALDYYSNDTEHNRKVLSAYLEYMVRVSKLLGVEEKTARPRMQAVLELEKDLAQLAKKDLDFLNESTFSIVELQNLAPFFNWSEFLFAVFTQHIADHHVDHNKVILSSPMYFEEVSIMLTKTKKSTIKNYVIWTAVHNMLPMMDNRFCSAKSKLEVIVHGANKTVNKPRWQVCMEHVYKHMPMALSAIFVESPSAYDEDSIQTEIQQMIDEITKIFVKGLDSLSWIDKDTKESIAHKANSIQSVIGYQDEIRDRVDDLYDMFKPNADFFKCMMNFYEAKTHRDLHHLVVGFHSWGISNPPQTVNAFYLTGGLNTMFVPVGILQKPFFSKNYSSALNWGGIGTVLGHELCHGFDNNGRRFDVIGHQADWTLNAQHEFVQRAQCLALQYSNYSVNGENINGNMTLPDNIADNGGIHIAFRVSIVLILYCTPHLSNAISSITVADIDVPENMVPASVTNGNGKLRSYNLVSCDDPHGENHQHQQTGLG